MSFLSKIDYIQPDAIFALTAQFNEDKNALKVNLGQGTYRDEKGNPWVLDSVNQAKEITKLNGHEYLPILGLSGFRKSCVDILFNTDSLITKDKKVASTQTISGTGSLHLAAVFLAKYYSKHCKVYISDPTWSNHAAVFNRAGFEVETYPYYDPRTKSISFQEFVDSLNTCPEGSIIVLHTCAHNPTGLDPTKEEWKEIASIMKHRNLFPIFDAAYLGFNSGDFDEDCWPVRYFFEILNLSGIVCLSFSKNMGLYGERVGCLIVVTHSSKEAINVESVLENLQRAEISNPPAYGARIVEAILSNDNLKQQWKDDLLTMSGRIRKMRALLVENLKKTGAPGSWDHISRQSGMFGFLGLDKDTVDNLRNTHHIYMASNSRISIAGLNEKNVEYVAESIKSVLKGK